MDPPLVKKLQKLRLKFHLEKRFKEEMERETAAEKVSFMKLLTLFTILRGTQETSLHRFSNFRVRMNLGSD